MNPFLLDSTLDMENDVAAKMMGQIHDEYAIKVFNITIEFSKQRPYYSIFGCNELLF